MSSFKYSKKSAAQVRSLGWEYTLEKGMATHSCILAWRISWTEGFSNILYHDIISYHIMLYPIILWCIKLYYVTYYTVSYYIVSYHIILYCIITYHRPLIHYMKKASKTVDKVRWQLGPQPKPLFYLPSSLSAWKKKS